MKAVIFDLDGTLLDTLADLADAVNLALKENRLPGLPTQRYKQLVGSGVIHLCRRAVSEAGEMPLEQVPDSLTAKMMTGFVRHYNDCWDKKTRLYPGIETLLAELSQRKVPMAILSNKPDAFTQKIVRRFFPQQPFKVVYGQHDVWPKKPDPSLAHEICRQMEVSPRQTVLVGDSGSDMQTAVNGGFYPVGVLWGFRDRDELTAGGARRLAADSSSLLRYLLEELS